MLARLNRINVKYTLAFIGVALALLIVFAADALLVNSIKQRMTTFSGAFNPAISAVLNADRDLYQARLAERELLDEAPGSEAAEAWRQDHLENAAQAQERMEAFLDLLSDYPTITQALGEFEARFSKWFDASTAVFDLHAAGDLEGAAAQQQNASRVAFHDLRELYNVAGERADDVGGALEEETLASVAVQQRWVAGFAIIVFLLALAVALVGPNLMSRAIRQVSERIRDITEGEGDLTARIQSRRRDEIGELACEFNAFIARMDRSFQAVRDSARSVGQSSSSIAAGSEDLASRTEQQASALQETASSMEEMSSIVSQNSETARHADGVSTEAANKAELGIQEVERLAEMMQALEGSSRRVGEIIEVIDSIAFQTNILALNASVEAARAGEHGKGFAVVASEVRMLASRSAQSAQEIRRMVGEISSHIADGVKQTNRSKEGFEATVTGIRRVSGLMNEIALAVKEQELGIQQVGTAVTQMDSATQQNVSLVSETSHAASEMQSTAQRLLDLVMAFKLSETSDTMPSRPAVSLPAKSAARLSLADASEAEWEAWETSHS
ncbi:methyl-accepting chemotaxis protein [Halomonas daqiaonensis]|uniref:Methyl-accepting chemotaxis sensory transducer n=1 Tax=Halomonas daqiaonensis TaxID=650850 RepID=A0A1H7TJI0_9GAMM|nr:methyl-accepting chemotaxis protein [Halomonas daqiaonensis]SEL84990.1 methyl-accepting chemotaxis sensory transducer [Halomonas daqiaonensis]